MKKVREHARTLQQTVIRGLGYHISCASLTAITWNWSHFWFPRFCMNWSFIFDFEVFLHFVDHASRHTFLLITNLMHFFLYLFIHFISLHVSSITVLIIRRSNSINTSSGMINLCDCSVCPPDRHTEQSRTQTNHTRWCINTIRSPDDEQCDARNM